MLSIFTPLFDTYKRKFTFGILIIQSKNRKKKKYPAVPFGEMENFSFEEK